MHIQCPGCGVEGEFPDAEVPPEGRDIDCKQCGTRFRIGGPGEEQASGAGEADADPPETDDGAAVEAGHGGGPPGLAAASPTEGDHEAPAPDPGAEAPQDAAAAEAPPSTGDDADAGADGVFGGGGGSAEESEAAGLQEAAAAGETPSAESDPEAGADSESGAVSAGVPDAGENAAPEAASGGEAGTAEAQQDPPTVDGGDADAGGEESPSSQERLRAKATAARAEAWIARLNGAIRYDFPNARVLADWLRARESFDGIDLSDDEGETWRPVPEVPEFAEIQPTVRRAARAARPEPARPADVPKRAPEPARPKRDDASRSPSAGTPDSESAGRVRLLLGALLGLIVVAAVVVFLSRDGERTPPSTPAGNQAAWMVRQLNGDVRYLDAEGLAARLDEGISLPPEEILATLQGLSGRLHAVRYMGHLRSEPHRIDALLRNFDDTEAVLVVHVAPTPPHRIVSFRLVTDVEAHRRRLASE